MIPTRIALAALASSGVLLLTGTTRARQPTTDPVALAQQAYRVAVQHHEDLSSGPCLGEIKPGWVADIAHQPRQPEDDLPQNQCAAYRSGQAKHFVELAPDGSLIRVH